MVTLQRCVVFAGISLTLATLGWGQAATTSVRGTVSDPQAAVVPGANVTISNVNRGFSQSAKTDDHGVYQFLQIPPGTYTLTVSKSGFATIREENLQLMVNLPATANVTMTVQGETTTVEVTTEKVQVNTEDAALGNAFGTSQIAALPFEGRDPVGILSLQPGVTFVGRQTANQQETDSRDGSVSGARSDQTNVVLDGIDNNDTTRGFAFQGALRSTLDSLQEFRVTTSNANADAGRSSGAQVALVTKSGTNKLHGSLYEYNRSSVGVANDWFNEHTELKNGLPNRPAHLIRNTFGTAIGGPLRKDHIFFFLAYEGQRTRENAEATRIVPSDNLRQGIVSYPCDPTDLNCSSNNPNVTVVNGVATLTATQLASMDPNCTGNGTCPLRPGANPAVQQFHDPKSLAEAISVEASELLELFLWKNASDVKRSMKSDREFKRAIEGELADVLCFSLSLANVAKIDFACIVKEKIEVNRLKYPIEKSRGRATKYNRL